MTAGPIVRPLRLDEVGIRIDYFHDASDSYLLHLGIDRALLPSKGTWRAYYEEDFARPLAERETYNLAWELDGRLIGFSSVDHIAFGEEAFMHLHPPPQAPLLPTQRLQRRPQPHPPASRLPLCLHQGNGAEHDQLPPADHEVGARAGAGVAGRGFGGGPGP